MQREYRYGVRGGFPKGQRYLITGARPSGAGNLFGCIVRALYETKPSPRTGRAFDAGLHAIAAALPVVGFDRLWGGTETVGCPTPAGGDGRQAGPADDRRPGRVCGPL